MMTRQKLLALAGAGALALAPLGGASAQGNSYCEGKVQASSFYFTTEATHTSSTITYWTIIQNVVGETLEVEVTFRDRRNLVRPSSAGPRRQRLGPWGTSQPFQLGVVQLNNSAGTGGLNVPADLVAGTTVTCRVPPRTR